MMGLNRLVYGLVPLLVAAGLLLTACPAENGAEPADEAVPEPTAASESSAPESEPTAVPVEEEADTTNASESDATGEQVTFTLLPEESSASYAIDEVFISDNNTLVTAVGVTTVMSGELTLNYDDPTVSDFGTITVDISALKSDRSRRDRAIRREWLESTTYPLATFNVTEVRDFPADPQEGVAIDFQLVGDLLVKETTNEVVWDVSAVLEGDRLSGTATLETTLEEFNIPIPSILGVLSVTDGILLTMDFVFVSE